ncbi:FecR family protein [Paenibacillus sp. Soil750]|uniref:FecR family protein n=1 Tax=Paenibacillus sp. Soil750 TaxID=1736398 RepID=UPI001F1C39CD|nr:FecR family protein [Paenibacillus sp. Soil750]
MTKKSFISVLLSFSLVFSLVSVLLVKPVDAKTVRVAIISALSGDVTIKKGGGSKTYDAYESMSLNQGDTVYTGDSSSVTLNLASGDADVTLGDNAELNVSDLNSANGNKKSKLKVWAGSMWVKVKSLAGADDEFEVETPTAVMGVRGTQFYVSVDPVSGKTKMAVGSGRVSASTVTSNSDETQTTTITYVNPTQEISLDSRDETNDLDLKVEFFDLEDFIKNASPEIIKELILNKAEIDKENDEFIAKKQKEIADGSFTGDKNTLSIKNQSDLDKVKQNLDNLIGNVAKQAIADKKLDQKTVDAIIAEVNKKIDSTDKKLDLSKVKPLDKTAGVDPELEKKKQEELKKLEEAKLKSKLEKEKAEATAKQKLADALKKLEEEKKKIAEEKLAAEAKAKAEAEAKLKASLTEQEKKAFDTAKEEIANGKKPEEEPAKPSVPSEPSGPSNPSDPDPQPTPAAITLSTLAFNPEGQPATDGPNVGAATVPSNFYYLNIDFTAIKDIYAVEVHLLYGTHTFNLPGTLMNKDIFFKANDTTSADYIREYTSESGKELVYAVTKFGDGPSVSAIQKTSLVSIPMTSLFADQIRVGKIVIVKKNGQTIEKLNLDNLTIAPVNIEGSIIPQ